MTKIICLELNEVPQEIMKEILGKINMKEYKYKFEFHPTISSDEPHLHPWVTWSSVHRGVNFHNHKIKDINQECSNQDKKYPTLMSQLSKMGYKVGVFGSMHSGSVPSKEFKQYSFFVPDAFSSHDNCKPRSLIGFQRLNLSMSKSSAREVSKDMPKLKIAFYAFLSYIKHPFKGRSFFCIIKQLISEVINPWKKTRRRTLQSDILFDIYMNLLIKHKPDYSNFFTNHLASSMHRFWEAKFPKHYKNNVSSKAWINKYKNEINHAIDSAGYYLSSMMEFVDNNNENQLWILSSMGQAAVENYKKSSFYWKIVDMNKFISSIIFEDINVKTLTQMIPIYSFEADPSLITKIYPKLRDFNPSIDFKISSRTTTTIAFTFNKKSYSNNNEYPHFFNVEKSKKFLIKGIEKIKINEHSGSSAYHVPEGIFYRYGKNLSPINDLLNEKNIFQIEKYKNLVIRTLKK